jgi:tetratricopeptide (TPR) repeat protein
MSPTDNRDSGSERRAQALANHDRARSHEATCDELLQAWSQSGANDWLTLVRHLMLQRDGGCAGRVLELALREHPQSTDLQLARIGLLIERGETAAAERTLRELVEVPAARLASSFLLARLLKDQGRMHGAAQVLRVPFESPGGDLGQRIQAVELLDDCGRKQDAAAICEVEIGAGCRDPRLHAYAAMLLSQLGQFHLARERYLFVAAHSEQAPDWHVPLGLAGLQRYADGSHPDFVLFQRYLGTALNDDARTSLLFALGKAHDDIGEYGEAARLLREANARLATEKRWSRKLWRRSIEMRSKRRLPGVSLAADPDWTPVFVVGVPRSGTTLVAQRLAEYPRVCHRGELPWLPVLAERLDAGTGDYRQRLQKAAATYAAQLRQDDAASAHWFIDKQPRNFLQVDLILSLFPNARVIQCQRSARDTALSLWMQSFHDRSLDFACDFTDIAAYIRGARQLMAHWQTRFPDSVRTLNYEDLAARPAACLDDLADWLGLAPTTSPPAASNDSAISTASLWQARQPIHTRSVDRWRAYAAFVPELLQLPEH